MRPEPTPPRSLRRGNHSSSQSPWCLPDSDFSPRPRRWGHWGRICVLTSTGVLRLNSFLGSRTNHYKRSFQNHRILTVGSEVCRTLDGTHRRCLVCSRSLLWRRVSVREQGHYLRLESQSPL